MGRGFLPPWHVTPLDACPPLQIRRIWGGLGRGFFPLVKIAKYGEGIFTLSYNQIMRQKRSAPKTLYRAGKLRRQPTPVEHILWQKLRRNQVGGVAFRRQHAIGSYIVDFCAPSVKLVLELDGSQHMDQAEYDANRTAFLAEHGYRVIR